MSVHFIDVFNCTFTTICTSLLSFVPYYSSVVKDFIQDEKNICKDVDEFTLNQKGMVIVSKKWRNTLEKVYIVDGVDSMGKKNKIKFFLPNIYEGVRLGDTLVKNQNDSVYFLYKKGLIIKYIDMCKTFKIDSVLLSKSSLHQLKNSNEKFSLKNNP